MLTDDLYMKKINKKWRKLDKATNVLSFPVNKIIKEEDYFFIGDIVLSYETILSECKSRKKNLLRIIFTSSCPWFSPFIGL